jgi:hypothetical protein
MSKKEKEIEDLEILDTEEDSEETEDTGLLDLSSLEGVSGECVMGIVLDVTTLEGSKLSKKDFVRGINDTSYDAGIITTLLNAGVKATDALNYVLNLKLIDANIKMTELRCTSQVEASKNAFKASEDNGI